MTPTKALINSSVKEYTYKEREQYANQRVIEELENLLEEKYEEDTEKLHLDPWYVVDAEDIEERIKELKQ